MCIRNNLGRRRSGMTQTSASVIVFFSIFTLGAKLEPMNNTVPGFRISSTYAGWIFEKNTEEFRGPSKWRRHPFYEREEMTIGTVAGSVSSMGNIALLIVLISRRFRSNSSVQVLTLKSGGRSLSSHHRRASIPCPGSAREIVSPFTVKNFPIPCGYS